jgi:hypothetical protein
VCELVSALLVGRRCNRLVHQDGCITSGHRAQATQRVEPRRIAIRVGDPIRHRGGCDGAKVCDSGSLIGCHPGAKQIGNGDSGDDQHDGDDDEKPELAWMPFELGLLFMMNSGTACNLDFGKAARGEK